MVQVPVRALSRSEPSNRTLNCPNDSSVRQREQGRDAAQFARRRVPSVLDAVEVCMRAGAPGITVHPRADRRHITPEDVRDIARVAGGTAADDRIQHRRRSAARPARSGPRSSARPVHAGAGRSRRDHEPGRLAARARRPSACRTSCRGCSARGIRVSLFVDAAPEPVRWAASVGRRPRRALHRTVRARVRAGRARRRGVRSIFAPRPPASRTRSASASTPVTISISTTSCSFATCRISTRCRSVTRSCRARCSSA